MSKNYKCPVCGAIYIFVAPGRHSDDETLYCELYSCEECGSQFTRYFRIDDLYDLP